MVRQAEAETLLRRLEWTVIRRLDGLLHGDYRTFFRGFGLDLADLREYQFHDDVRHIDWNVTARMQIPHVRDFQEDRQLTAWFLLDLSPSVDFGSGERSKRAVAAEFVAVLARLFTRHGNRVGAVLYDSKVERIIPAGGGRPHVLHLLHSITARPPATGTATRLADLLTGAVNAVKRRSLVFVVSDFFSAPGWEKPLAELTRRHEVVAVRLLDPMEMDLPDIGMLVVQDAETGEQLFVDTQDRNFRKRFADAARRREASLRENLSRAGVDTLELVTDENLADTLMRFADLRKLRTRLAGGGSLPRHLERSHDLPVA